MGKKEPQLQHTDLLHPFDEGSSTAEMFRCNIGYQMLLLGTCECPPFWVVWAPGLSNFSTLPKTNIFAENRPSQNETCLPLPPCFKTKPLVSKGVYDFSNSLKA